jgi:Zn-dependent membrane protease YugP
VVVFQLINLPVEYDASSRAKQLLGDLGLVTRDEAPVVKSVLSAAALTYVAATLTAILTFVYLLLRAQGQRD